MAIVTVWGETGCRIDELSRLIGLRMRYEVVGEARMASLLAEEFGDATTIPDKAWAAAATASRLSEHGLLSAGGEAQMQFQVRLQLAKHGIVPAGKAKIAHKEFGHPSEELFANLLDFYHIEWKYEPRSFPLQWDKSGK